MPVGRLEGVLVSLIDGLVLPGQLAKASKTPSSRLSELSRLSRCAGSASSTSKIIRTIRDPEVVDGAGRDDVEVVLGDDLGDVEQQARRGRRP